MISLALGGAAGAVAESMVNLSLLAAVVRLAGEPSGFRRWLRTLVGTVFIALLFGITAAGATLLYRDEKTFGIVTLLLPLALVQGSLVTLARRAHEQALADEAQRREREGLLRREAQALRRAGDASEVERKRIAADLHDSVIQDVTGLLFAPARCWAASPTATPRSGRESASRPSSTTPATWPEGPSRNCGRSWSSWRRRSSTRRGSASALRQLLTRLDREQISWVLECTEEPLDQRHQRLVYRVVQEALRNVVKHRSATASGWRCSTHGGRLVATIRDDGRGFTAAERADRRKKGHAGLGLLVQTVRDGGGRLTISSARGKGTTLRLVIPMLRSPAPDQGEDATGAAPDRDANSAGHGHVEDGDADDRSSGPGPSVTGRSRVHRPPEPTRATSVSAR